MNLQTGLVSVTFRHLVPELIIPLCRRAGLKAIEWGGDVHVPPNDLARARRVGDLTRQFGLAVASYGSYFRLGQDSDFNPVLETTSSLGCSIVRVWVGQVGSHEAAPQYRERIIEEARKIADKARDESVKIAFEFHAGTLNDTSESCLDLLAQIDRPNVGTYWQPMPTRSVEENQDDIGRLAEVIAGIHVFHWLSDSGERRFLREGWDEWRKYFGKLSTLSGFAMLEFVKDDDVRNFMEDASALNDLVGLSEHKEK